MLMGVIVTIAAAPARLCSRKPASMTRSRAGNAESSNPPERGVFSPASRRAFGEVIARLVARGADGVLLACTEIELLVGPEDSAVPLFPTTRLHVLAAVDLALASSAPQDPAQPADDCGSRPGG